MACAANASLKASAICLSIIKNAEGCRNKAYLDNKRGRVWTIGYGHTKDVKEGDTCTQEQANAWLITDVTDAENTVKQAVNVPLSQARFDALVSFVFNVGRGRIGGPSGFVTLKNGGPSTLLRLINNGEFGSYNPKTGEASGAAAEFLKWTKDEGVVLGGLVRRRETEVILFSGNNV